MRIRVGARGSALSRAQVDLVSAALRPFAEIELVTFTTSGDRLSAAERAVTGKDSFTREIDEALADGRVDLAVHSLKDLPSRLPPGLTLAAVPGREDPRDILVSARGATLAELPAGSRVGTSSARRRAQVLIARPDLVVLDARGNVDTRIRRLREGRWDAIVLARAGLARLGRLDEISELLPLETMLPAIGQGALALVTRAEDAGVRSIVARLDDLSSHVEAIAERALLDLLEAGCRAPLAGLAKASDGRVRLTGAVFAADGSRSLVEEAEGPAGAPEEVGHDAARRLLARGAAELIAASRS